MTRINTNIGALNAQKNLQWTNASLQQALNRLSTGLRINSGKDDPAGLIASEILRSDIVSTSKAITNSERANQMIATADSALGQISLLLHDIRGLVEEAANAGAMSDEQIAANQLQIDAALQSINRVAQTTKFQGRGLLDGTLDFITNSATIPDIKNLQVNQATIGSTGQLNVNTEILVPAAQASIRSASGDAMGTAALRFAPRTSLDFLTTGGLEITAMTAGPQMEGVTVTLTATGADSATYNQETKVLALTYIAGTTQGDDLATLINNIPGGGLPDLFFAVGTAVNVTALIGGDTLVAPELVFTAKTAGTDFNNVKVKVQTGAANGAAWNAGAKEILLTLRNTDADLDAITTLVAASAISAFFDVDDVAGGSGLTTTTNMYGLSQTSLETKPVTNSTITGYLRSGFSAAKQAMATISFAPVAAALLETLAGTDDATLDIQSKSLEEGKDVLITFVDDNAVTKGTEYGVYNSAAKTLDVHYDGGVSTVDDVVTAINKLDGWTATNTDPADGVDTVDATGQATTKTVVDKLQVAALNPGANYNNLQVRFEGKIGLTTPIASYDAVKNEMVIQVDTASTANSTFAKIVTAINGVVAGGVAGGFSANWITPTNGLNYIYGASKDVYAVGNTASSGGNTLLADLVIEVAGSTGSEAFNFGVGTSANQIASAFNLVTDSTGIWAAQDNGLLSIKSNGYGSKYFTAASVTNEGIAGTLKTALSASRATGADADAKINGVTAVADGNILSITTSTLDLSLEVTADKVTSFNFSITGGGALFQLGPDVVANQQARMGIQSVNTTRLGGASGRLYMLGNGLAASLINNVGQAANIADDAVTSIINLRGRLGAFQKTTLDTNIKALSDTVVALTEAESSIRDADFAAETANLTRAQILTQSGMAVLGIANSQPQNVLALLRNL